MMIEVGNLLSKVIKAAKDEREWLDDYLSFPDKDAFFKRAPVWKSDNKIHMFSTATDAFPTGFLQAVQTQAEADSVKVELVDRRKKPCAPDPTAMIDWLRDYQQESISVAKSVCRGIFHHATGAGKTEIAIAVCEVFPVRWLFLTHRKDLLSQTAERFMRRTGEEVGIVGDGIFNPKRVTVAMFQTVFASRKNARMQKLLQSIEGVLVDECHVTPAATFYKVAMALPNAYFRYGFSGTPFARGDKKSLYTWGSIGPVIHRIPAQRLIEAGVLAKPRIRMITVKQTSLERTWREVYDAAVVRSKARNEAVLDAIDRAVKPCLVFVNHIAHGKTLLEELQQRGTTVEFVWGKHATYARKAAIERLTLGESDVLLCNVIFQEGIDIPELQSVVIAQGGKSVIAALQRVGRGMRRRGRDGVVTKTEFEVFDIRDRGCGCKEPKKHLGCRWLEKHSRQRMAAYASEKYETIEEQPRIKGT